jgi:hypothetical protein
MRVNTTPIAATLALTAALLFGGCKSSTPPAAAPGTAPDGTAAQQPAPAAGTPASAPAVAPAAGPATATNEAPAGAPPPPMAANEPAPPPPPPEPVKLTARSGSAVVVTVTEQLAASKNNVGDRFTGVLAQPLKSSGGGGVIFPRGAHVVGTVVAAKGRGRFKGSGALGIEVNSIAGMAVSTTSYEKEEKGKGKRTAGFIGGGAGGGALIGGLAGGGKGALIGGLVGAGAGTAGAAFTGNKDVVIPSESTVTFTLTAPVTITVQPNS